MRILVIGATGMLGNAVFRHFDQDKRYETFGTVRNPTARGYFSSNAHKRLLANVDVLDQDALIAVISAVRPEGIINCTGLIKQLDKAEDPLVVLPINAMFPHRLARLCSLVGIRLVHMSTDCVFSGREGNYSEEDSSDAEDLYGKSKYIGEVHDLEHVVTLRTSIIGHELNSNHGLVDWFLSQDVGIKGYAKAIFSGLPTIELARVIKDYVFPTRELQGLYHVSSTPISKLELLLIIAKQYGKNIDITSDDGLVINRSLAAHRFNAVTGYSAPAWPALIQSMYRDYNGLKRKTVQ